MAQRPPNEALAPPPKPLVGCDLRPSQLDSIGADERTRLVKPPQPGRTAKTVAEVSLTTKFSGPGHTQIQMPRPTTPAAGVRCNAPLGRADEAQWATGIRPRPHRPR